MAKAKKTSDLGRQTSDFRPQTSDLRLQASDPRPEARGLSCEARSPKSPNTAPATEKLHQNLTDAERAVLEELNSGGIVTGRRLAATAGLTGPRAVRDLRVLIQRLRFGRRIPIIGWVGGGYQLASDPQMVKRYIDQVKQYGRDYFALGSVIAGVTADVIAGQMLIESFGEPEQGELPLGSAGPHESAWRSHLEAGRRRVRLADVVRRVLDHMGRHPQLYREDVAEIRERCGVLLLSPEQQSNIRKARKLLDDIGLPEPAGSGPGEAEDPRQDRDR